MSRVKRRSLSQEDQLDRVFGALADRTRRALLASLAERPAMVTELAAPFDISLPAVSRHIKVLEHARLVQREVSGRVHCCTLQAEPLKAAEVWLRRYRSFWTGTLDALARYVEDGRRKPRHVRE
jgi:DNA-binding transcriptional ArsR family regulator